MTDNLIEAIQDAVDNWSDEHTSMVCDHADAQRQGLLMNECWRCRMQTTVAAVRKQLAQEIRDEADRRRGQRPVPFDIDVDVHHQRTCNTWDRVADYVLDPEPKANAAPGESASG